MTISTHDFEYLLRQEASLFSMRDGGKNESAIKTYIVCDFEFSYDRSRHHGYVVSEGGSAEQKRAGLFTGSQRHRGRCCGPCPDWRHPSSSRR